jgi:hypothetical protein
VSVNVRVAECVRVTTTGVGDGVPGRNVSGVGMPLGTLVGNGVGVEVGVAVGPGGVGVSVGVLVGVSVGVAVAVGNGVRLGVRLGVTVAVREGVLGGDVTVMPGVFAPDELGTAPRNEWAAAATNAKTTTNVSASSKRSVDCFTVYYTYQPNEVTSLCLKTAGAGERSSIAKQRCPTLYHKCLSRLPIVARIRCRGVPANRCKTGSSWPPLARSPVGWATDPDGWPDVRPDIPEDGACDYRRSTKDLAWTCSGSGQEYLRALGCA